MIFWILIWIILAIPVLLIAITDPINYVYKRPPSWHAPLLCICLFIIIFSCVMVFSERASCTQFLEEFHQKEYLIQQINKKASNIQDAERQIQGKVTQLNTQLFYYLHRDEQFGIFSPFQREIRQLKPLQLHYYDTVVDPYI